MKKTLLITLEFPPFYGGVSNYYYNLASRLPADKISVLTNQPVPWSPLSKLKIYHYNLISQLPIWPKWLPALVKIFSLIKKERVEMVWVGQVLPLGTISLILNIFFKIKYFVSFHGSDLLTAQRNKWKKFLLINIISRADFITVNSQFTKNEVLKLKIKKPNILLIYPGVPLIKNRENNLTEKISKSKNIILTVARLTPRKNIISIIQALPKVIEKQSEIHYFIIGRGPEKEKLEQKINELNLEKYVSLLTNISNDQLIDYYQAASLFILLPISYQHEVEGLGIVFLEAAQFQKPIIASDHGGCREVVIDQQTGLIVEPQNLEQISGAILKILNNQELASKLGEAAKAYVQRKFNWEEEADKLINYLQ